MITSKITGKTYDPAQAIYITNPKQVQAYAEYFKGWDYLLDIHYTSEKRPDALTFVWQRCPETKRAKELWDQHLL